MTTFEKLHSRIIARLDQAPSGDRGWFLITRVHLSTPRLKDIVQYLHDIGGSKEYSLTTKDYHAMAGAVGVTRPNPGITLRRHHLLAMEHPLHLLRRTDIKHWENIILTDFGVRLATTPNASAVLEAVLSEIIFCKEPSYTKTRTQEYREFNIKPYPTILEVMARCDGWLDRDEYDLFVSRIRNATEIRWAAECTNEFRTVSPSGRKLLLAEVRKRIHGSKAYQNWRDMALHTFSLFNLGVSVSRVGQRLILTKTLTTLETDKKSKEKKKEISLVIPNPKGSDELGAPPTASDVNTGTDAELLVGKILEANGWKIAYYTNRRGFGFDLWAQRGESAMVIEVKSALRNIGTITLTRLEFEAAQHHGPNYVLAIIENLANPLPNVHFIQNPAKILKIDKSEIVEYKISRSEWSKITKQ